MLDLIVIAGAPGSGKTTISKILRSRLQAPLIDFGSLRNRHLDSEWSNAGPAEEQIAFENLVFVVESYAQHGTKRSSRRAFAATRPAFRTSNARLSGTGASSRPTVRGETRIVNDAQDPNRAVEEILRVASHPSTGSR
jgi:predicted ATPase